MADEKDVRKQLTTNILSADATTYWGKMAIGAIDSALNAVESNNLLFACDRLSLAIAHLLAEIEDIKSQQKVEEEKHRIKHPYPPD